MKKLTAKKVIGLGARLRPRTWALAAVLAVASVAPALNGMRKDIFGISIGTKLAEAREILKGKGDLGGRDARGGARREAIIFSDDVSSEFKSIAYKSNGKGKIVWVSGFLRPGREIPFAEIGDTSKAVQINNDTAIWQAGEGDNAYRLVAKGGNSKAAVIYLLSLEVPKKEKEGGG